MGVKKCVDVSDCFSVGLVVHNPESTSELPCRISLTVEVNGSQPEIVIQWDLGWGSGICIIF